MRLLFLYPDISKSLGVLSKVVSKLNAIVEQPNFIQVEAVFFGDNIDQKAYSDLKCKASFVSMDSAPSISRLLNQKLFWPYKYEKELKQKFDLIHDAIAKLDADFLVLRDFAMSKSGISFLKKCKLKFKVILESNTDIYSELRMKAIEHGKWYEIEAKKELQHRKKSLEHVDGVIAVTNELKELYWTLGYNANRIRVISNGTRVKKITDFRNKWGRNQALRLVFLAGTSSDWNGMDRLEHSLVSYRGKTDLIVDVFGISAKSLRGENFEMNYKGRLSSQEISAKISDYQVGISTLALYKKKMEEACTLKVRTYLALGLPVLLAYNDTDLKDDLNFVFRVKNDESLIDFENVVKWYSSLVDKVEDIGSVTNEFALNNLSYKQKSEEISSFLIEISDSL